MINTKPRKPRAVLSSNDPNFEINQYGVFDDTRLMIDDLGVFVDEVNQFGKDLALDLQATSTTSNAIGIGNKTFIVQTNLGFAVGMILNVASSANVANRMRGAVVSYSKTTGQLVLSVEFIKGSGTFSDWVLSLALDGGAGESNLLYALTTGTGTAYEAAFAQPIAEYNDNQTFKIKFHANCETNATLRLSSINPPLDIKIQNDAGQYVNVFKNDIIAGHVTLGLIINGGTAILIESAINFITDKSNKIINGAMNISQRGATFSSPANNTYTLDRWVTNYDGTAGTFTISQNKTTSDASAKNELYWDQTVAGTGGIFREINQRIENVATLAGKTVTVSFIALNASNCPSISVYLGQFFGTGGSPSASVPTSINTIAITNTRTLYQTTFNLPSLAGKVLGTSTSGYLQLAFRFPSNAVFGVTITEIQLQEGSYATEFLHKISGQELVLCQRYYENGIAHILGSAPTSAYLPAAVGTSFKVTKRVFPTMILNTATESNNINTLQLNSTNVDTFRLYGRAIATGDAFYTNTWTANAEL